MMTGFVEERGVGEGESECVLCEVMVQNNLSEVLKQVLAGIS